MKERSMGPHPDLLPWFAAGRLDGPESREIEDHISRCEECAEIAKALTSMGQSVSAAVAEHVGVEELVELEAGNLPVGDDRRARVDAHLAICARCREDLAALGSARKSLASPASSIHWWAVAAAAVIILGIALPMIRNRFMTPGPGSTTVLLPQGRSPEAVATLGGPGPWTIQVVLPYSGPAGDYRIRVEREDGETVQRLAATFRADTDARIFVEIESIDSAGAYRMVVEPVDGPPGTSYTYPFRVK